MTFIHARLPREVKRTVSMSHELPAANAPAQHHREIDDWIRLALELGATGFFREDR